MDSMGFQKLTVELFSKEQLGCGSYGAVYKAKCGDLLCAAKLLHPLLFAGQKAEQNLPMHRFLQECDVLSGLKHPNIVQYLGTDRDKDTGLPVLVMELMEISLTAFLAQSNELLPYHIQVNLCHDIALALSFLHWNKIIHRDLSSNNILLIGHRAKVADFGMAKLAKVNPNIAKLYHKAVQAPGMDKYMSPEALAEDPNYTDKLDCFSFGVLVIQILTKKFPDPAGQFKNVKIANNSLFPSGIAEVRAAEVERRQNHLGLIDRTHPLLHIAKNCLKNRDVVRPSASDICKDMEGLKASQEFAESVKREKEQRSEVEMQLEKATKEQEIKIAALESEVEYLRKLLDECTNAVQERDRTIEKQIEDIRKSKRQQRIQDFEHLSEATNDTASELEWRDCESAPQCMFKGSSNAVVHGPLVYLKAAVSNEIFSFHSGTKQWLNLPQCGTRRLFTIVVIDGKLTVIGGIESDNRCTNTLVSLQDQAPHWTVKFPPMLIRRCVAIAICNDSVLVVAGGVGDEQEDIKSVEVMDLRTKQWSKAVNLPRPLSSGTATVCNGQLCFLGGVERRGEDGNRIASKALLTCSLSSLLESCKPRPRVVTNYAKIWSVFPNVPFLRATCVTFPVGGDLLAIGGKNSSEQPTTTIHRFSFLRKSWEFVCHMHFARSSCFAAVLDDELIVIGGCDGPGSTTNSIEIASVEGPLSV